MAFSINNLFKSKQMLNNSSNRIKTILITGADSGLGANCVQHFLNTTNFKIIAVYFDKKNALQYDQHNPFKNNLRLQAICVDQTKTNDLLQLHQLLESSKEKVDFLLANAGVSAWGPLLEVEDDAYQKVFDTNVIGTKNIIKYCLPHLSSNAKILVIGSNSTKLSVPFMGPYPLSKVALKQFVNALRRELQFSHTHQHIKITLIEPGSFKTPMWQKARVQKFFNKETELGQLATAFGNIIIAEDLTLSPRAQDFATFIASLCKKNNIKNYYTLGRHSIVMNILGAAPALFQDVFFSLLKFKLIKIKKKLSENKYTKPSELFLSQTNTEELIVLLSLATPFLDKNENIASRLQGLVKEVDKNKTIDWDYFWKLVDINQCGSITYINLKHFKLLQLIPSYIAAQLELVYKDIKKRNQLRIHEGLKFIKYANEQKIPIIILKGIYFAEKYYQNTAYKKMNDIDLMIAKKDIDGVINIFKQLDYFSAGELIGKSPEKQKNISHHLPPYFSQDLACMMGVRWELINPYAKIKINYDQLWERATALDFFGHKCYALSATDNLFHLCLHLSLYKSGIKEVADIYNLILSDNIDWSLFKILTIKGGAIEKVYKSLSIAHCLFPINIVSSILLELEVELDSNFCKNQKLFYRKIKNRSVALNSRTSYITQADKEFAAFKLQSSFKEKLICIKNIYHILYWPSITNCKKLVLEYHVNDSQDLNSTTEIQISKFSPIYFLKLKISAVTQIIRTLSEELGFFIFILLNIYLIYALIKSAFNLLIDTVIRNPIRFMQGKDKIKSTILTEQQLLFIKQGLE